MNIKHVNHFNINNMQILYNEETTCGYKKFIMLILSEKSIYILKTIINLNSHSHTHSKNNQ